MGQTLREHLLILEANQAHKGKPSTFRRRFCRPDGFTLSLSHHLNPLILFYFGVIIFKPGEYFLLAFVTFFFFRSVSGSLSHLTSGPGPSLG